MPVKGSKRSEKSTQKMLETRRERGNYYTGEKHCHWKGGKSHNSGFIQVLMHSHPNASKTGYIAEHRLVMEKQLGRYLNKDEKIHHINGDKTDNRPENLFLCQGHQHHQRVHHSLEKAREEAIKRGLIKFNPNTGEYYV
jgi:hypothetical protein